MPTSHYDDERLEDFRDQMNRCPACGALVDGDVCDADCAAILDAEAEQNDDEREDDE